MSQIFETLISAYLFWEKKSKSDFFSLYGLLCNLGYFRSTTTPTHPTRSPDISGDWLNWLLACLCVSQIHNNNEVDLDHVESLGSFIYWCILDALAHLHMQGT